MPGLGHSASFGRADGIGMSPAGMMYLADWQNGILRSISPEGDVNWYAGRLNLTIRCKGVLPLSPSHLPA